MRRFDFWNKALLPGVAIASLAGVMVLTAQPAKAGSIWQDAAVGAGVGFGTGLIIGDDAGGDDLINGAAAGAAVHVADEEFRQGKDRSIVQDVGVGAVTSGAVGILTNDDSFLENAAQGAITGAVIHVID